MIKFLDLKKLRKKIPKRLKKLLLMLFVQDGIYKEKQTKNLKQITPHTLEQNIQ